MKVMLLEMPDFSYNFAGLANVADLPGLNVTIKASLDKVVFILIFFVVVVIVVDQLHQPQQVIRQTLVWPNRLGFQFPMDEVSMAKSSTSLGKVPPHTQKKEVSMQYY